MVSYKLFIIMLMFLMHYIEDFHLQGCLANLKQKSWWSDKIKDLDKSKYKDDYKMSLFAHSFENALMVILPLAIDLIVSEIKGIYSSTWLFILGCLLIITPTHYIIDDLKANKMKINLVQDQLFHIIVISFISFFAFKLIGAWIGA